MRKFLLGLLCGVVLAALIGVIGAFAFARLGEGRASIGDASTLVLKLSGELPERAPIDMPLPFLQEPPPLTLVETWSVLRRAANDSKIKAVVIEPRGIRGGWAKLEELRAGLAAYRKAGKPLYAHLQNAGTADYYVAAGAEKVFLQPEAIIDVKGLRIEAMYLKNTLDKIGVKVDIEHAGRYKDFGDMYTRTSMTPETREVLNSILDQFYGNLTSAIASGRKKNDAEVKQLIDQGPFLALKAKELGLVDALAHEDQMLDDLKGRIGEVKKVSARDYLKSGSSLRDGSRPKIALLVAEGGITGSFNTEPDDGITAPAMAKWMKQIEKDDSIKGVILRVDSPGGDAFASDEILYAAKKLSKKKPMVISMADYAASGGYMISMTGDPVIAYPNTITGSIGVVYGKVNLRGLYDKVGIQKDVLQRGKFAGLDSEYTPMTEEERAKLRESVDAVYRSFLQVVADGRKKKPDQIDPVAQGRAWTGQQALAQGLVDQLGGLDAAVEAVKKRAKIEEKEKVAIVPYPPRRTFFEYFASRQEDQNQAEAAMRLLMRQTLGDRQQEIWTRAMLGGGMLRLMPFAVSVR
jgi:protease-4